MRFRTVVAVFIQAVALIVGSYFVTDVRPASAALPQGDVVFVIDESGSMGDDIATVRTRVNFIASQLSGQIDFRLGLVGYGSASHTGTAPYNYAQAPHFESPLTAALTDDLTVFSAGLANMNASGGTEEGFAAARFSVTQHNFRQQAGVCIIQITDEDADPSTLPADTKAQTIADLNARNATWYGIVNQGGQSAPIGTTAADYGPTAGSLSEATGGQVFSLSAFNANPDQVLQSVLQSCAEDIVIPVPVDIKPTSCPNPLNCKAGGVIPVAINGTSDFDATTIDPSTVTLEGVSPTRSSIADVSAPAEPLTGKEDCVDDCTTDGPDGFDDLTLKFDKVAVFDALAAQGVSTPNKACLVLDLKAETFSGESVEGEDVVRINCNNVVEPGPPSLGGPVDISGRP